jgi:DNA-binding beta-propeller fold protein YncE
MKAKFSGRLCYIALLLLLFPMGLSAFFSDDVQAFEVKGLKTPKSFIVDPVTGNYFISNINGKPTEKDNNGFITKLDKTGKIVKLKFVEGGKDGITLHAPKGLAVIDNILYVTDIDTVKSFDKETGNPINNLDLTELGPTFLNDLTHDAEGNLYVTDMVANMILKIETQNGQKTSILVKDPLLGGPNGIVVNPQTGNLMVVSWDTGSILEVDLTGQIRPLLNSKGLRKLDGIDLDDAGNIYTSSFTDGRIYKIRPDFKRVKLFKEGLTTPADISLDQVNQLVLIPSLNGNKARTEKLK